MCEMGSENIFPAEEQLCSRFWTCPVGGMASCSLEPHRGATLCCSRSWFHAVTRLLWCYTLEMFGFGSLRAGESIWKGSPVCLLATRCWLEVRYFAISFYLCWEKDNLLTSFPQQHPLCAPGKLIAPCMLCPRAPACSPHGLFSAHLQLGTKPVTLVVKRLKGPSCSLDETGRKTIAPLILVEQNRE